MTVRGARSSVQLATMPRRLGGFGIRCGAFALSIVSVACASTRTAPKPFPMPGAPPVRRPPAPLPPTAPAPTNAASAPSEIADGSINLAIQLVREALELRGTPYRNGGSDPAGFDCSGFTQWVFSRVGLRLPRETREQFQAGTHVPTGTQQAGDLIFFTTTARGASHVGIALGDDTFVHAPSSRGVVRVESLSVRYWSKRVVGIRRMTADEP